MSRSRWLALPLCLFAAACGGEGGASEPDTPDSIPKAEFLEQANAVCAREFGDINAAVAQMSERPSQKEIEQVTVDSVLPSVQKQVDGIRAIGLPEGDEEEITSLLDDTQAAIDQLNEDPSLTGTDEDPFADIYPQLSQYDLDDCVS